MVGADSDDVGDTEKMSRLERLPDVDCRVRLPALEAQNIEEVSV
jgi:hypothetical protein